MDERFEDTGDGIYAFMEDTLVVCPQCSGRAVSRQVTTEERPGWFSPRRLGCTRCAYTKDWSNRAISRRWHEVRDDYFELPLWLQTPCCGEVLWAYNEAHLAYLEDFVRARLRERQRDPKYGWSNHSVASRLPQWMKAGKNREVVLKGLGRLRSRLEAVQHGVEPDRVRPRK
jgi:hypothetical protein